MNKNLTIKEHFKTEKFLRLGGKCLINKTDGEVLIFAQIKANKFSFICLHYESALSGQHNRENNNIFSFKPGSYGYLTFKELLKIFNNRHYFDSFIIVDMSEFLNAGVINKLI